MSNRSSAQQKCREPKAETNIPSGAREETADRVAQGDRSSQFWFERIWRMARVGIEWEANEGQ